MMKMLLIICLMFLFLVGIGSAATETFYVCNGGSGSNPEGGGCAGAWDLDNLDNSANWASVDSNDGKIGPNDEVLFLDDGGVFRGRFKVQRSGLPGKPITLKAGVGENPVLSGSERFTNSNWELWYDFGGKKIYRLYLQKGSNLGYWSWYPVISNDEGATWSRPNMEFLNATYNSEDDIRNNLRNNWYLEYKPKNHYYVYYRADEGVLPGIWELGFRPEVIDMESVSNIVLDNIDIFGPLGCSIDYGLDYPCNLNNEFWSAQTGTTGISLLNNQNLTLKNLEVSYGGFKGINMGSSSLSKNILLDNVNIHHYAFAMHFSSQNHVQPHTQGSQGVKNVTIQNSRIWEIGSRAVESGDRELIGLLAVDGAVVRNNYLGKYGHDYENEAPYNSKQLAIVQSRNILVENNYFHDSGTGHITFGGGSTTMGTKDVIIRNNVFDRRGYNFHPDAPEGSIFGIYTAFGRNRQSVIDDCDNNYPGLLDCYEDHTGNIKITNNLFINGRNTQTWNKGSQWSTIFVGWDYYDSLIISNNIFYKNAGTHEILFNPYWDIPNDLIELKNNIFFADSISDWNNNLVQIGASGSNWSWSEVSQMNTELDAMTKYVASGNVNTNPLLVSSVHGPENSKALQSGSPARDSGLDLDYLGSGFNFGLDPTSNFLSQPPSIINANHDDGSGWEIGPYVYTGEVLQTCVNQGFNCCNSCSSNPRPEFDGTCSGQVCCGVCETQTCDHPAEQGTADCIISKNELDDYVAEWKSNSGVTLTQVIEAIGIWKSGGY